MPFIRIVKLVIISAGFLIASLVGADAVLDHRDLHGKVSTVLDNKPLQGDESAVLDHSSRHGAVSLTTSTSYFEDEGATLKYSDIALMTNQFIPLKGKRVNFGFTRSTFWFRTVVTNTLPDTADWLLEVDYPLLDDIVIYEKKPNGELTIHHSGDKLPFKSREIANRNFLFHLSLEVNTPVELITRVSSSSSMQVPINIWSNHSFIYSDHTEYLVLGLYFGTLIALFAYNLMLIFWIRDGVYVYYAGYLAFCGAFQLSLSGLSTQYLWPESLWLAERGIVISLCLAVIFACKFSHSLLQINKVSSALDKAYHFIVVFFVAVLPLSFFADYQAIIQLLTVTIMLSSLFFLFSAYKSLQSGISTAKYYLMALCVFLVGCIINTLKSQGLIADQSISEYAIMSGSTIEAILLSFALSHRFKVLKDENNRMQTEAKEILERSVTERTKELESTLDELSVANTRLEGLNNTDTLTGVRSRAYFDEHAEFVWKNTDRSNEELAIMMLDVDNFKYINDNYGHLIGDEILILVAQAINNSLTRSTDQMARYGGEEFIVILPAAEREGSLNIAEKIRASIENIDTMSVGLCQAVTISIGITMEQPANGKDTLRDAIERADKALYQAKNSGKNCCVVYEDNTSDAHGVKPQTATNIGNTG